MAVRGSGVADDNVHKLVSKVRIGDGLAGGMPIACMSMRARLEIWQYHDLDIN
jgi:hypothetical protein